jgi:hypothetical protein
LKAPRGAALPAAQFFAVPLFAGLPNVVATIPLLML